MSSPKPPTPQAAPQTDATYERTRAANVVTREETRAGPPPAGEDPRSQPLPAGGKIAGDMTTEEPDGWDQAPQDIHDPQQKRHPRPDGVGGSEHESARRNTKEN